MKTKYVYLGKYADIVACWTIASGNDLLLFGDTVRGGYVHLNTLFYYQLAFGATFAEVGEVLS